MTSFKRAISTGQCLILTSWLAIPAVAKEDNAVFSENLPILEEVIVTARKYQETLQDSPVAISVLDAGALKEAGVSNIRDLQQNVPGLIIAESANKSPAIFIRGVGQREANAALDPGVGVYINGIYIARTDTQLLDTVDTQSIQVLRGPQGTLFGKNNTGGALLVTTKEPHTAAFEGYFSTRLGNFGRRDAKVGANIPLNDDSLAARFSINSVVRDGYLENVYDGKDYGDEDRLAATVRLAWQASEVLNVDVFSYWSKQNERGAGLTCLFQNPKASVAVFDFPNNDPDLRGYERRCRLSETLADDEKILLDAPSRFKITSEILALTLTWELDEIEIKSISSLSRQSDIILQEDYDGTDTSVIQAGHVTMNTVLENSLENGFGNFTLPEDEERKQFSQELQLIGTALDENFTYTVGLFFAKEDLNNTPFFQLIGNNGYVLFPEGIQINGIVFGDAIVQKLFGTHSDLNNKSYAFFVQGTHEVTDWFQLTAGFRYTVEDKERIATIYEGDCDAIEAEHIIPGADGSLYCGFGKILSIDTNAQEAFLQNPPDIFPVKLVEELETVEGEIIKADGGVIRDDKKFSKVTPTITASFNLPEELFDSNNLDSTLIYLTWAKGFKAGGFEMKGLEMVEFDQEEVTSIELGWKVDAYDHRLRFNAAIYSMDYENMQTRIAEQGKSMADVFLFISNAGDATLNGMEMELTALPMNNLRIQWSVNIFDTSYDEFETQVVDTSVVPLVTSIADRSNEEFAIVPKLSYSLSAMYEFHTRFGAIIPRLSLYYKDEVYIGLDSVAAQTMTLDDGRIIDFEDISTLDEVTLWNFRMTYLPSDKLNVVLFVDNLTDEDYFQGGNAQTGTLGSALVAKGIPRAYGLEATINF